MIQTGKPGPCGLTYGGRCELVKSSRNRVCGAGIAFFALTTTLWQAQLATAQCQYEIVEPIIQGPNCPFSGPQNTHVLGMNSKGWVAGYYLDCQFSSINHAFIWKPGEGMTTLPKPPDAVSAFASGVNDEGWVIGGHTFLGEGNKAFILNPNTQEYTYLEPLHPGASATDLTVANAINNNLMIAGSRVISKPGEPVVRNAVIWMPFGKDGDGRQIVIDLGDFGVGPNSALLDLTQDGTHLVGWSGQSSFPSSGVQVLDGATEVFGPVPTTESSTFRAVSETGVIAAHGVNLSMGFARGAILANGTWHVFAPPAGFQTTGTVSRGLNNVGQVLVSCSGGGLFRPHLWQHGKMHDLSLLVTNLPDAVALTHPRGINDTGAILLRGTLGGKTIGIVLEPADHPSTDLNSDCVTSVHDLLILLKKWGPCADENCPADFTGNGAVGVPDLLILLSNWD